MWRLTLVLALPCLIVADISCPGGELTCPDGKKCCPVDHKTSCCDVLEAGQLPRRPALLANHSIGQAGPYDSSCTPFTCTGTCCSDSIYGCCPIQAATCCRYTNKCCQMLESCCGGGGCCPWNSRCCSRGWSDPSPWCCRGGQRCGRTYLTCYAGAAALRPTALLFALAAAGMVAYATKKL